MKLSTFLKIFLVAATVLLLLKILIALIPLALFIIGILSFPIIATIAAVSLIILMVLTSFFSGSLLIISFIVAGVCALGLLVGGIYGLYRYVKKTIESEGEED